MANKAKPWKIRTHVVWEKIKEISHNQWVKFAAQILVIGFCVYYLIRNLRGLEDISAQLKPELLIAAVGVTFISMGFGVLGWNCALRTVSVNISIRETAHIHLYANLAKYMPGYAWQLVGKAVLSRKFGIDAKQVGLAMTLELVQMFAAGLGLSALLLPETALLTWTGWPWITAWMPVLRFAAGVLMVIFPPLLANLLSRFSSKQQAKVSPVWMTVLFWNMVASWIVFGFSFWLIGCAVSPLTLTQSPLFILVLVLSFLIGFLVIFVPGSIGVRESVMVFLLNPYIPSALAVSAALLSRLVLIISELLTTGAFWLYERLIINKDSTAHEPRK